MKGIVVSCILLLAVVGAWLLSANAALPVDARATLIVVEKSRHLMTVYDHDRVLRIYHVSLGRGDNGPKQREGDNRTPEGHYVIDAKNDHSAFYRSLHISYPSPQDISRAKSLGISPGGAVMIHGLRNDLKWLGPLHRLKDWTKGCIAVTDSEMDELWQMVDVGTSIEIGR